MRGMLLAALLAAAARADTVYLKNGESMEGSVVREDARSLELDIGYGTVTLDKANVRRVSRAAAKGSADDAGFKAKYLESGRWIPTGGQEAFDLYHEAREARRRAMEVKTRFEELLEARAQLVQELLDMNEEGRQAYDDATEDDAYSTGRGRAQAYGHLQELSGEANAKIRRIKAIDAELGSSFQAVPKYLAAFQRLDRYMRGQGKERLAAAADKEERSFYAALQSSLAQMGKDFRNVEVHGDEKAGHVVVDALLDGKVHASLLVDTGASVTVLSQDVVSRLGLTGRHAAGVMQVQVADGRVVNAPSYNLDSVAVGGQSSQHVLVAAMPEGALPNDGLLGMSFLKNFVFEIDPKNRKLVLKGLH